MLVALAAERRLEVFDLAVNRATVEGHETVRRSKIAVVLRDLVFENPVIPPGIPGEIRKYPMVLVAVLPVVRQNQIRVDLSLEILERVLNGGFVGEKTVVKFVNGHVALRRAFEEQRRS